MVAGPVAGFNRRGIPSRAAGTLPAMPLSRRTAASGVVYYTSPQLAGAGVPHAFSTRRGGVSGPPFDALNLGNPAGGAAPDPADHVAENFRRLAAAIGCDGLPRREVRQVHGSGVVVVVDGERFDPDPSGDALVTAEPGAMLAVRVADCCPVLVATADGRAVAAVHAGWKGAVAGVVPAAVAALCRVAGATAADLVAAVGPCIGPAAFEVGPEVIDAFDGAFGTGVVARRDRGDGGGHVDLAAACGRQLRAAGVPAAAIDVAGLCTVADAGDFFSHRRDHGRTGRMAAVVAVTRPASTCDPIVRK